MALILRYAVRSDLGLVRGNNEDSVYAGPRLLAIADGMGGHAAGEVASKIVIGALENLDEDRPIPDLMAELRSAVLEGNSQIADESAEKKELEGMGTTLTALRFSGSKVGLVHVGDSRAYLLRAGELSQITHDDTYVQYLVDSGKLTPEEAKDHPRKSVILRALNGVEVEPDVAIREALPGDRYLLCTDGLSDVVSTETMFDALRITDPQESADRLVELALRGGGPDNVTVVVADVVNARVGDVVDDVPVIAGAFVDPSAAAPTGVIRTSADPGDDDEPGSAAERAARMTRQAAPPPGSPPGHGDEPPPRRRRRRRLFLALALVVLVIAALGGTYAWTQTQYFVGRNSADVVIFKGVNTEVGPVKLFSVYRDTGVKYADLNPSVQSQVRNGINADSKTDAERIVTNLDSQLLPVCRTSSASTSGTSGTASGSTSGGASGGASDPSGGASVGASGSGAMTDSPSGSRRAGSTGTSGRRASSSAGAANSGVQHAGSSAGSTPSNGSSDVTGPSGSSGSSGSSASSLPSGAPVASPSGRPTCRSSR